jgi:hypothetical protein
MPITVMRLPTLADEDWDFNDPQATRQHLPRLARKYEE